MRNLGSTWIASLNTQSFPSAKSWVFTAPENTAWPALGSFLVLHFWQGCRKIWRRRAATYRAKKFLPVQLASAVRKREFIRCVLLADGI